MKANLHIHTNNSDGKKTVSEINELAISNNFSIVAITDHDTVNAIYEINQLNTNVNFIIGVEMNTIYNGESVHVLGYFNGVNDDVIKYFKTLQKNREERCLKIIDNLKEYYNIEISYDEVAKIANGTIGRPHIQTVITNKYHISNEEVFRKYLGNNCKAYVPSSETKIEDAVKFLHDNNALVVLAHPIQIKTFDYRNVIKYGFDGIEAYHPDQDKEYSKKIIEFANENNLLITGGADYHGRESGHGDIFDAAYLTGNDVDKFIDRLTNLKKEKILLKHN